MMRRFYLLSVGVLVTLALGAVAASGASATSLELKELGTPVAKGAPALGGILIEECVSFAKGSIGANGKASDKASFTIPDFAECSGTTALSGTVTAVKIADTGTMSFKAKLTLKTATPCNYSVTKFSVPFVANEGQTIGAGTATGKLVKTGSSPSCAKKGEFSIEADVTNEGFGPFETELT